MPSLHIYNDSPDFSDRATSDRTMPSPLTRIPCNTRETFVSAIGALWGGTTSFDRIAIDTHGNRGMIFFNHQEIDADWWARSAVVAPRAIGAGGGSLYFSGCNVAEGEAGWSFLIAAARCVFKGVSGRATGWTSMGFANPFNGHTLHVWGDARTVFVDASGRVIERYSG